jgi:hypothetical protein
MIAAWDRMPPVSVTSVPMREKSTDQAGDGTGQTSTSPRSILANSASLWFTRAGPVYVPGAAATGMAHLHTASGRCPYPGEPNPWMGWPVAGSRKSGGFAGA